MKRGIRSFFQAALGMVILQAAALAGDAEDGVIDADLWKRVLITAVVAGFIAIVSWAQNALEETTGKALLK
jgi:hypothetical protein